MKTINIKGKTLKYEIVSYECGDYGASTGYETIFYDGETTIKRKKYWLFGEIIEVAKPIFAFNINTDIENLITSKQDTNVLIKKHFDLYQYQMNREKEILNGEII